MVLRRNLAFRGFIILAIVVLLMFVASQVASQITSQSGENVDAAGSLVDMSFYSGDEVKVTVTSTDDVIVAGGDITSTSTKADHLIVAGGEIKFTNIDVQDLYVAGGDIEMRSGGTQDDLVAAGGEITISPDFTIGGSAMVSGGDVKIEAPVGGELRTATGKLYLNSEVVGDARLIGDEVELGPKARIGGNLQFRAKKLEVSPDAVIVGTKSELAKDEHKDFERMGKGGAALAAGFGIAFFVGLAVLVVVTAVLLPSLMNSSARMIREKPLATLGIGFLIAVAGPVALLMLFASIMGIPLGLLTGVIFLAVAPIAIAAFAYFVGMEGRRILAKKTDTQPSLGERVLWSLAAIIVVVIIGKIPFVGFLMWIMAFVIGVGAVMTRGGKALAQHA